MNLRSETVRFDGASGHTLAGRLHRPVGHVRALAVFSHCFTCGKDVRAARILTAALADRGIATLRFDFTGLGESDGDFGDTHFSSNVQDLIAAVRWMEQHMGMPVQVLVGHSLGGAAVLMAAPHLPDVKAVATVGAPSQPGHVAHLFAADEAEIRGEGQAVVQLAGRPFTIRRQFLDDLENQPLTDRLAGLSRALLVLHSPTVSIDHAAALYAAARHPKSFVSLDGADHLLSRTADAQYAGSIIAAWAERYITPAPQRAAAHSDDVEVRIGSTGLAVDVIAQGKHHLRGDEPTRLGGTDTGPTPYDLLLAGLGACTAMTVRMYADRKGWPLHQVDVHLTQARVHATDCKESGRMTRIDRVVDIAGPLDASQVQRLLQIADRCPVHRTLEGQIEIETTLGDVDEP